MDVDARKLATGPERVGMSTVLEFPRQQLAIITAETLGRNKAE